MSRLAPPLGGNGLNCRLPATRAARLSLRSRASVFSAHREEQGHWLGVGQRQRRIEVAVPDGWNRWLRAKSLQSQTGPVFVQKGVSHIHACTHELAHTQSHVQFRRWNSFCQFLNFSTWRSDMWRISWCWCLEGAGITLEVRLRWWKRSHKVSDIPFSDCDSLDGTKSSESLAFLVFGEGLVCRNEKSFTLQVNLDCTYTYKAAVTPSTTQCQLHWFAVSRLTAVLPFSEHTNRDWSTDSRRPQCFHLGLEWASSRCQWCHDSIIFSFNGPEVSIGWFAVPPCKTCDCWRLSRKLWD